MEVAVEHIWQQVATVLRSEGWMVGWAEYADLQAERVWLAQAVRNGVVEESDGTDLDDALANLYCLTR